ncbi:2-amino-4-hydroxy-6-hydroxymethyldihydropteridine diphosphokinase [Halomonas sp. GXIMD04776]|uniref:2-amino-4-hydroxy-6- hydroxymethyldihydropteridine diphosphokinase n=1 Tax=Halomonas sp. GXIMD04776 TaxID=3415605 RepID=UPI003C9ECF87
MNELSHHAYIGLGSNLDGPRQRVEQAIIALDRLPVTGLLAASACYASKPVGPQDQPDFINAVAWVSTRLSPLALLDQLQALEQQHRRRRLRRWGPRTLDMDLLLFDDLSLDLPRLKIPHPAMHERAFVLFPLAEIAPESMIGTTQLKNLLLQMEGHDLKRLSSRR